LIRGRGKNFRRGAKPLLNTPYEDRDAGVEASLFFDSPLVSLSLKGEGVGGTVTK